MDPLADDLLSVLKRLPEQPEPSLLALLETGDSPLLDTRSPSPSRLTSTPHPDDHKI